MISKPYNGWSATIRSVRGQLFYSNIRRKKFPQPLMCELCGSTNGMSYHAEEYGSTWEDYVKSCHALCCYCHASVHVRFRFPNRWNRFVHRMVTKEDIPVFPFQTMGQVYAAFRPLKDIDPYPLPEDLPPHWLLGLKPEEDVYKVALVKTLSGKLVPDFTIYPPNMMSLEGLRYDADSGKLWPYQWSTDEPPNQPCPVD